jgi:hypothetical protein
MTTHPDHQAFGFSETRYDPDTRKPIGTLAHRGLSKREYFAALAMQGLIASETANDFDRSRTPEDVAKLAVDQADMLIEALNGEIPANG